jgi:peptide/nickel transport system permease protein
VSIATAQAPSAARFRPWRFVRRNPTLVAGAVILVVMALLALFAPLIAGDPIRMQPAQRLRPPSAVNWLGTDSLGRDVFARTVYGARVSLMVGLTVAFLSVGIGLMIGLLAGFFRTADTIVMRFMDGLMAIPAILLAIALVSLTRASVTTVIVAIMIPEIPRVVRLVRSVVLSVREAPYVEAAVAGGAPTWKILLRHIMPSTFPPLIVQATYVTGSATPIYAASARPLGWGNARPNAWPWNYAAACRNAFRTNWMPADS